MAAICEAVMILNPILDAVASSAAACDWPISGITLTAPLLTGVPTLTICWAHFGAEVDHEISAPSGVDVDILTRVPDTVHRLAPMIDAERHAIRAAWALGAWDVQRTAIAAGYHGVLPPEADPAWRTQGWVAWYWRPMMRGPEIRSKQRDVDITLDPWSFGRIGEPPEIRIPPIMAGRAVTIRLGRGAPKPQSSRRRPATRRQRAYLLRLLADAGDGTPIPRDLGLAEASSWIDRLLEARRTGKDE